MARTLKSEGLEITWKDEGTCPIRFVTDLFAVENTAFVDTLKEITGCEHPRVLLVADANVVQRTEGLGTKIGRYVQTHGLELAGAPVVLGGGEKIKSDNQQSLQRVIGAALEAKVGASDVLVALGGGTLLDVAGFAAAQIRGGLRQVRVPTTVAAMVDGAYAETAALDAAGEKDVLRVVSRPSAVFVDVSFARTVLDGVWRGGLGEIVRQVATTHAPLFKKLVKGADALRNRDFVVLEEVVRECVASRIKKGSSDIALWCALRLEAMSGYKLPHGYAVPIALAILCAYAAEKGVLAAADAAAVKETLDACGALDGLAHSHHLLSQPESILRGLQDWQRSMGSAALVLPSGIGKSAVDETPDPELFQRVVKSFLTVSTEARM